MRVTAGVFEPTPRAGVITCVPDNHCELARTLSDAQRRMPWWRRRQLRITRRLTAAPWQPSHASQHRIQGIARACALVQEFWSPMQLPQHPTCVCTKSASAHAAILSDRGALMASASLSPRRAAERVAVASLIGISHWLTRHSCASLSWSR